MACPPAVYDELPHHKLRLRGNDVTSTAACVRVPQHSPRERGSIVRMSVRIHVASSCQAITRQKSSLGC